MIETRDVNTVYGYMQLRLGVVMPFRLMLAKVYTNRDCSRIISVIGNYKMWSERRQKWVPVKYLRYHRYFMDDPQLIAGLMWQLKYVNDCVVTELQAEEY
jgi:hypothetical protein